MILLIDTREQNPLEFVVTNGVEVVNQALPVGDYGAVGQMVVIERKSIADLFSSFSKNYEAERAKILKANELGYKYILAIEASALEVRKGHQYWKDGQLHASAKDGLAQIRQLMTISRKYQVDVWFCESRRDMAFRIMEYLLAFERMKPSKNG